MSQITVNTNSTPYLLIIDMAGQFYNVSTSAFEVFNEANWADYALTGTQYGSTVLWDFTFPTTIPTAYYDVMQMRRSGATPASSDIGEGNGTFHWDMTTGVLKVVEPCDTGASFGDIYVNHNYPTTDFLLVLDDDGNPMENVLISAFTTANYDAGNRSAAFSRGSDTTNHLGEWERGMYLPPDAYTLVFITPGYYVKTREITVE